MGEINTTVVAGVLVLVLGQIITRFILDPLKDWRELRGEIEYALHMYGNIYVAEGLSTPEEGKEARRIYRDLASKRMPRMYAIPAPVLWFLQLVRIVPRWDAVRKAQANLRGLSNSVFDRYGETNKLVLQQEIRDALRLHLEP